MKIYLSKNEILSRLRMLGRIVKKNSITAELESFKFNIKSVGVQLTGADSEGEISTFIPCKIEDFEDIAFLVNSKIILDALKELPEQPLVFDVKRAKNNFEIKLNYHNGSFKFIGLSAELFPVMSAVEDPIVIALEGTLLNQAFKTVSNFTGYDDLRPIFMGVNVSSKNNLVSFAATNGNKMALFEDTVKENIPDFEIVIPNKCVSILLGLLAEGADTKVLLEISPNNFQVSLNNYDIRYRLTEGKYPNYRAIIPNHHNQKIIVDTTDIVSAIKRVSVFSNDSNNTVIMNINKESIDISAEDIDFRRSAKETIQLEDIVQDITIGFNSNFILDVFTAIEEDKTEMKISDPSKAVVFHPHEDMRITILLMPVLINI